MNTTTLTLSINNDGLEKFKSAIQTVYHNIKTTDSMFAYTDAASLMNAATEVAQSDTGCVLRWDYLRPDWADITVIEETIDELSNSGYAWQYIKADDYDMEEYETEDAHTLPFYLVINEEIEIMPNTNLAEETSPMTITLGDVLQITASNTEICVLSSNEETTLYEGKAQKCPGDILNKNLTGIYITNKLNFQTE